MGSTRAPISVRSFLLRPTALPLALALYLMMVLSVQGMGQVGEVAAGWTWGPPPRVAVDLAGGVPRWSDPALSPHGGDRLGPALCSQTRPLERLQLGSWWVPLAINAYTGGVADWPARADCREWRSRRPR